MMHTLCFNISSIHLLPHNFRIYVSFETLIRHQFSVRASSNPNSTLAKHPSAPNPKSLKVEHPNPIIVEYLIKEYGVSRDKAIFAAKTFGRSTTVSDLTTVPEFLKPYGFSDTHVRKLFCKEPRLICSRIERTLKPKLELLEDLGLSGSDLADLIVRRPSLLRTSMDNCLIPNINALRYLHHSDDDIIKYFKRNKWLYTASIKTVSSNVDFLAQSGIPDTEIKFLLDNHPGLFTLRPGYLKDIFDRVEKLGVKKNSRAFKYALGVMATMRKSTLKLKLDLYRSYGWSEENISSAFSRTPGFLSPSEGKIRMLMSFLMDELEYSPKEISLMPQLFKYSLEKRLRPRGKVMKILNSRGLLKNKVSIQSVVILTEKMFFEDYVTKFVDIAPDVEIAYMGSDALS